MAERSATAIVIAGAAIFFGTITIYWNTLGVPFLFDDSMAILENPSIRNLAALGDVLSPPNNGSGVTGRPVVNLSFAINHALGGTSVAGYHAANIFFHALGGLALFGIVRRTLCAPSLGERFEGAALPIAALGTVLWSFHPLQTESVTCVVQRTENLVGLFYLLTLYCFVRATGSPSKLWPVLSIAACALGMGSKEVMVSAPLMVLLYDRTFIAGTFADAWRQRRRYYCGLGACLVLLAGLVASTGGARGEAAGFGIGLSWWSYALKQCEAIILYLRLSLWPNPLVVFYGVDVVTNPFEVWPEILVLAGLVASVIVALRKAPVLGFMGMWFFAILAPSSSVVPLISQTVSEHRMYLPLAALTILGVTTFYRCAGSRGFAFVGGVAILLGVLSIRRNVDYRSELAIWNDTVAKVPGNARARVNLGAALHAGGNPDSALAEYQAALRIDPNFPEALNNIASIFLDRGRPAEAIEPCVAALRLKPKFALAHNNLGIALTRVGRVASGIDHLQTALRINPDLAEAHCNLTAAFTSLGQAATAIEHGERAVQLNPGMALAHFFLANAYLQNKQIDRARLALEAAIRLKPEYAEAELNLGSLYYQAGDPARAIPHFEAALRSNPDFVDAHNNIASALFQTGRPQEAIEHYRTAIRLQPGNTEARLNHALVLARMGRTPEAIAEYEEVLRLSPANPTAEEGLARLRGVGPAPNPQR